MELFFIVGFLSFLFGLLNGSYFSIAAFNDNKILRHPLFKWVVALGGASSLMTLFFYFSEQVSNIASSVMLLHFSYASIVYLVYSGSYFLGHSLSLTSNPRT